MRQAFWMWVYCVAVMCGVYTIHLTWQIKRHLMRWVNSWGKKDGDK